MTPNQPSNAPNPSAVDSATSSVQTAAPAGIVEEMPRAIPEIIDLQLGKELSEAAAISFSRDRQSRLIVLAGPVKGGKTTLLTSLYELFQWGTVADQCFAWSSTLPGFEQKCHQARTASENPTAETQRTQYQGPEPFYLHLRTSPSSTQFPKTDFLFTDVSGELFDHAVNSEEECKLLTFVKRAAHLVLLIDGAKVVQESRNAIVQKSKSLLRSLLDCEMVSPFCYVTVVWAKCDHFANISPAAQKIITKFREDVEADFTTSFSNRLPEGKFRFMEIAARPKENPQMGFGKGVEQLFRFWLEHAPHICALNLQMAAPKTGRESELYAMRHNSSAGP
jgi:hypothetical protein